MRRMRRDYRRAQKAQARAYRAWVRAYRQVMQHPTWENRHAADLAHARWAVESRNLAIMHHVVTSH